MTDAVRNYVAKWIVLIDERLQVFLFILIGIGLLVASLFLWKGLITGDNWVTVCGILVGSNAIGGGISQIGKTKTGDNDNGNVRPF